MLRIEIEELLNNLSDRDLQTRKNAKNDLYEIEKDGLIPIEILIQQLVEGNVVRQIYAVGAICRVKNSKKKEILEKYFLESENFLLITSFFDNFMRLKKISFENTVLEKYKILEKKMRKKETLQHIRDNYTIEMLKYLENFASKRSHKLLFKLLNDKNKNIQYYSLSALSKTNADIPNSLLKKIIKMSNGTPKYLAQVLLDKSKNE